MSDVHHNNGDMSKLKLSELRKICKENKLNTVGTKLELISRITESQEKFVILQPGDEAELLGVDYEIESSTINIPMDDVNSLESLPVSVNSGVSKKRPPSPLKDGESQPKSKLTAVSQPNTDEKVTTVTAPAKLSDAERIELRAKRFGVSVRPNGLVGDDKMLERAKRFGLPIASRGSLPTTTTSEDQLEKLKKRADRFGETTSKTLESLSDIERKAKRLEKFGLSTPIAVDDDEAARKALRAEKFGLAKTADNGSDKTSSNVLSNADILAKRKERFKLVN